MAVRNPSIGSWSSGPKPPSHFLPVFPLPVGIILPVWILFPVLRSYLDLPRSWPGYHGGGRSCTRTGHGGCRIGFRFPGRWDGTQLAGQVDATYLTVWIWVHIYYRQLVKLLTDLGKIEQTAEARMWLFILTASLKTTGFLCRNVGINRGNLTLTVRILSVKSEKCSLKKFGIYRKL